MRRVMSIWFPDLPLDRQRRMGDPRVDGCFAITREIKNARRVTHLSKQAKSEGLHPNMSVADARAIAPHLLTQEANPERDHLLLRALWRWSDSLSPWAALDPPAGLFLDITGCAHLFGGEVDMCTYSLDKLTQLQMSAKIAVCDTKAGAWGLARFAEGRITISPQGQTKDVVSGLPLAALDIKDQTLADLRRTGLKTIGDLYPFKTSELARRFGLDLTQRLSFVLGHQPDPVSPGAADPVYSARMTLPVPVSRAQDVKEVLRKLSESVCTHMETSQVGARRFNFTVRCVDTGDHLLSVGFARPCFTPGLAQQQFEKPIDDLRIGCGADWFRLVAANIEPVRPRQIIIGEEGKRRNDDTAQAISTLGNRLGFDRIVQFTPQDSHIPEREFTHIEAVGISKAQWPEQRRERPERIFTRPQRLQTLEAGRPPKAFQWLKTSYRTAHAKGPERLLPEWWFNGDKRARDYWVTTTDTGQRLWLLTYPASDPPEWFIAGRFA